MSFRITDEDGEADASKKVVESLSYLVASAIPLFATAITYPINQPHEKQPTDSLLEC
jgi:hypothetical protein